MFLHTTTKHMHDLKIELVQVFLGWTRCRPILVQGLRLGFWNYIFIIFLHPNIFASVAQLVVQLSVDREVPGSFPVWAEFFSLITNILMRNKNNKKSGSRTGPQQMTSEEKSGKHKRSQESCSGWQQGHVQTFVSQSKRCVAWRERTQWSRYNME